MTSSLPWNVGERNIRLTNASSTSLVHGKAPSTAPSPHLSEELHDSTEASVSEVFLPSEMEHNLNGSFGSHNRSFVADESLKLFIEDTIQSKMEACFENMRKTNKEDFESVFENTMRKTIKEDFESVLKKVLKPRKDKKS